MLARLPRLAVAAAAVAGFLAHAPRASADYVLDSFDNPNPGQMYQISLLNGNPYTSPTTTVSAGVTRTVAVQVSSPNPPNFNSVSGTIGGGTFTMDSDNASKATSQITYTLSGAAGNLSGATGLSLQFVNLDAGTTATTIPVSVAVNTATGTRTFSGTVTESATAFTQTFDFASFSGSGDLGQVNSIVFTLNNTSGSRTAVDFALDGVSVNKPNPVPAPPGLLLAGVGGLALIGRARLARARN